MRSLYVKFTVTTIAIMFVSGLLAFLFSNAYYQQTLKPKNDAKNTAIALGIARYVQEREALDLHRYLENVAALGYQLYVVDEAGEESFFGAPYRETTLPAEVQEQVLAGEVYHGMREYPKETFVTGFFANELMNTIGVPLEVGSERYALFMRPNIKLLFGEVHLLLAWLLGGTIILSVIFVLVGTKFLVHPISKLRKATNALADGNYAVELDIDRGDEIGELALSFTQMVEQLETLNEMKSEFITNMTHDIQSPLANIRGYVSLLEKNNLSRAEKEAHIAVLYSEIERLSRLTKQLLLISSLTQSDRFMKKTRVNVSEQLKEVIHRYQWLLSERGIMLQYALPTVDVIGVGDRGLLMNVWENILLNAIKYNREGGSIEMSLREFPDRIEVQVTDTGVGMTTEEVERVFERFYRADTSRSSAVEGTGLGLTIAQTIVQMHGGHIDVTSNKGEGTTVLVTLVKEM